MRRLRPTPSSPISPPACVIAAALLAASLTVDAGCGATGGAYRTSQRGGGEVDRGETQGRMFDFVSNLPEGDDWQLRVRGSALWASHADGEDVEDLGTVTLSKKDTRRVWELIDALELEDRSRGKKDEDEGYVQLRLREPGGDEGHDIIEVYVSRTTEDEDVLALGEHLGSLIARYYPRFKNAPPTF